MALDIAALRRVLHHQFSRYFSILPFPAKHTSTSKHGGRSYREFKYFATFVGGTDSKKVQFCERNRARNTDEVRKLGKRTCRRRRWGERIFGPCQLNGTELKSFAWRQARHVVAGSWAWQSSRQRHACLPFLSIHIIEILERKRGTQAERWWRRDGR